MTAVADQLAFRYRPRSAGAEAWLYHLAALTAAVDHLTRKNVCFELDVSETYLTAALKPPGANDEDQQRKYWRGQWTLVILAMLGDLYTEVADEFAARILSTQAMLTRWTIGGGELTDAEVIAKASRDPKLKAALDAIRKGKR